MELKDIEKVLERANDGDFSVRIDEKTVEPGLRSFAQQVNRSIDRLIEAADAKRRTDTMVRDNPLAIAVLRADKSRVDTTDWSRDGRFVIFENAGVRTAFDLWVLPLSGDRKPFPFLQTPASERNGKLSPDGRWFAYESDETGEYEIYVQTFPGKEGKWQVSDAGGTRPVWRRDGKELFFLSGIGQLMAVDVTSGATFEHGAPKALFETRAPVYAAFDVSSDGKRLLMANPLEVGAIQPMNVIINWQANSKK